MSDATALWLVLIAVIVGAGPFIALVAYEFSDRGKRARIRDKAQRDAEWMANAEKWNRTT